MARRRPGPEAGVLPDDPASSFEFCAAGDQQDQTNLDAIGQATVGESGRLRLSGRSKPRWCRPRRLSAELQPVKIRSSLCKQRGFFDLAAGRGNALEGIENHLIAALAFVGRKIAFEHAAFGTKRLDAGLEI